MRAVLLDGNDIVVRDVPIPVATSGQILLEVLAAGLCHSDVAMAKRDPAAHPFELPLILGHEVCARIVEINDSPTDLAIGDIVAVHGPRGCGRCSTCARGMENHCPHAFASGIFPIGLGRPGGLAEFIVVDDPGSLVRLDGLDPVQAAPLTDAGLTSYHAIAPLAQRLTAEDTCVVIGIGGLGHLAVQLLTHLTPARIVAVDIQPQKVAWAVELGAHQGFAMGPDTASAIRDLTEGVGAAGVINLVGSQDSHDLAAQIISVAGEIVIVGVGSGILPMSIKSVPLGVTARTSYWGSRRDLEAVFDLARRRIVHSEVETVALKDVPEAYRRVDSGQTKGRIVALPAAR